MKYIKAILIYIILFLSSVFFYPKWNQTRTEATISWDVSGYYFYLPSIFIYQDLKKVSFKDSILEKYSPTPDFQQGFYHEASGNYVMKYSSGLAILMLPGFIAGHLWASLSSQYPADGFSFPYQICLGIWMLCYVFLGLYYLTRILRRYFPERIVAVTVLLLAIGTNYLNFAVVEQAQTHIPLFFIYALLLWQTDNYYRQPNRKTALCLGLLCGLATLVRPTEIISLGIPLLWNFRPNAESFRKQIAFFKSRFGDVLLLALAFAALVLIQPLYWKLVTGEWIVYSYGDQGFSFIKPHILNYVFSYDSGWLRYCPMMVLPFLGFVPLYFRKGHFWPVFLVSMLAFYIVTAWNVWNYGGSSGRAMIQYYPLLAFPLAALLNAYRNKGLATVLLGLVVLFCGYINIWWTYHAHYGSTPVSFISKEYFEAVVGRWNSSPEKLKLLDNKQLFTGPRKNVQVLLATDFSDDSSALKHATPIGNYLELDKDYQYTLVASFRNTFPQNPWIRVSGDFYMPQKEWDNWKMPQFQAKLFRKGTLVTDGMIRIGRFLDDGDRQNLYLDLKADQPWDSGTVQVWNGGSDKMTHYSNLRVEAYQTP